MSLCPDEDLQIEMKRRPLQPRRCERHLSFSCSAFSLSTKMKVFSLTSSQFYSNFVNWRHIIGGLLISAIDFHLREQWKRPNSTIENRLNDFHQSMRLSKCFTVMLVELLSNSRPTCQWDCHGSVNYSLFHSWWWDFFFPLEKSLVDFCLENVWFVVAVKSRLSEGMSFIFGKGSAVDFLAKKRNF